MPIVHVLLFVCIALTSVGCSCSDDDGAPPSSSGGGGSGGEGATGGGGMGGSGATGGTAGTGATGGTGGSGATGGAAGAGGEAGGGMSACEIVVPVISALHPELNGISADLGGDRVSSLGSPYQARVEVSTTAGDGDTVFLNVDGSAVGLAAAVSGGRAVFPAVTLDGDGDHTIVATCGEESDELAVIVDTEAPVFTTAVEGGTHFGPEDDASEEEGLQFEICASTSTPDALDLDASLGDRRNNFRAAIGTGSSEQELPATTGGANGSDGACFVLPCVGRAPFDVTLTLLDDAGNETSRTIQGLTCTSTTPSVAITDPVPGTGPDIDTHILAAGMPTQRVDQDATAPGAQYTVRACTDSSAGSARLLAGLVGGPLTQVGADVTTFRAAAANECPAGLGHVVEFLGATLPASEETRDTLALATATELRVTVTEAQETGTSPAVRTWVDPVPPTLIALRPADLCGRRYLTTEEVTEPTVALLANLAPTLAVTSSSGTTVNYALSSFPAGEGARSATFQNVVFPVGTNQVVAQAVEPSGNVGRLGPDCRVIVGDPPIVTWQTPTDSSRLNALEGNPTADADPSTEGWQGTLRVGTDVGGSDACAAGACTVSFTANGVELGTAVIDASTGVAELTNVTIAEGEGVAIVATTSSIGRRGQGSATLTVDVDLQAPSAISALQSAVADRRQTSFHLSWTSPSDVGRVAGYDVRVSSIPITTPAEFAAATPVPYAGTPSEPGAADGVDVINQMIERDYYFAVAAVDRAGNRSEFLATTEPTRARFEQTLIPTPLPGVANGVYGYALDGSTSLNGDELSDLVVGGVNTELVDIYFGRPEGYAATPNVRISGPAGSRFGSAVAMVGDIDGDGASELAVGAMLAQSTGMVYVFKGRGQWPAQLSWANADYVIAPDASSDPKFNTSFFGFSLARLGDFDGDSYPDFAIGAFNYATPVSNGFVAVIRGGAASDPLPARVDIGTTFGGRILGIYGPPGTREERPWFGYTILGDGPQGSSGRNTLFVAAPGPRIVRVYAIEGQSPTNGIISLEGAPFFQSAQAEGRIGTSMALMGSFGGVSALAVGEPAYTGAATGLVHVFFGDLTSGPFQQAGHAVIGNASATGASAFGYTVIGSGFSGRAVRANYIGDAVGDLVVSSLAEGTGDAKVYMIDGNLVADIIGDPAVDVSALASVALPIPEEFTASGTTLRSTGIMDLNGDGYGDLALAEARLNLSTPGQVWVLW